MSAGIPTSGVLITCGQRYRVRSYFNAAFTYSTVRISSCSLSSVLYIGRRYLLQYHIEKLQKRKDFIAIGTVNYYIICDTTTVEVYFVRTDAPLDVSIIGTAALNTTPTRYCLRILSALC